MQLLSTLCVDITVLQANVYNQALVRLLKIMLLQTVLTLKIDLCQTYFNRSKIERYVFIFGL